MRVEKDKVRAPEIGRVWLNSRPLSFRQRRGQVVLVEDYKEKCQVVIAAHTPEFRRELQGSSLLSQ